MPVPVALNANDDMTLTRLAADASLAVPAPGNVARRIEALAVTAGVPFTVVQNDRMAIEALAMLLGGGVCYQLTPGGVSVIGEILPADVAGMSVSVSGQVVGVGQYYGALSEEKLIDWSAGEYRRIEIEQATIFDYFAFPLGENDALRNTRGAGSLVLAGAGGEDQSVLIITFYRAHIGDALENGGWNVAVQSTMPAANVNDMLSEQEAARVAVSVSGAGDVRVYVDGVAVQDYAGVFGAGWNVQAIQFISLPFSTGTTEAQEVTAVHAVNVGAGMEEYSDGSLGWCE